MLSRIAICTFAACILFNVSQTQAHHSFAPYFDANKKVSISGTVKEYESRNPHSYLHVNAVDENGRTREYVCESHGVTQLSRIGITPQLFKAGTKVTHHRLSVAAKPLHVLFRDRPVGGRARPERERSGRFGRGSAAGCCRAT